MKKVEFVVTKKDEKFPPFQRSDSSFEWLTSVERALTSRGMRKCSTSSLEREVHKVHTGYLNQIASRIDQTGQVNDQYYARPPDHMSILGVVRFLSRDI